MLSIQFQTSGCSELIEDNGKVIDFSREMTLTRLLQLYFVIGVDYIVRLFQSVDLSELRLFQSVGLSELDWHDLIESGFADRYVAVYKICLYGEQCAAFICHSAFKLSSFQMYELCSMLAIFLEYF